MESVLDLRLLSRSINGLRDLQIAEGNLHFTERVWLNILQAAEHDSLGRAIIKDGMHVCVSRVWR